MRSCGRAVRLVLAPWCLVLLLVVPGGALAGYPTPRGPVNDFAGVLGENGRAELEALLQQVRDRTTAEIAVVTVPSLDGMSVEQYASGLFEAWGIGKKGRDNGVLILVAPDERRMRIEVGYGLEGVLPDGLAGAIIRDEFTPHFKEGDYPGGILAGTRRVAEVVRANHTLTPDERRNLAERAEQQGRAPTYVTTPFLGLFVGLGGFVLGLGLRAKAVFPVAWGGMFTVIPSIMAAVPSLNVTLWILVPLGFAMLALGALKAGSPTWMATLRGKHETPVGSSGWVTGSPGASTSGSSSRSSGRGRSSWGSIRWTSGGSRSGSGHSSSGSFGGGRSGGGGASGSW